jgi:hypothetical protein
MERRQFCSRIVSIFNIVCRTAGLFKMSFEGGFEARVCPSEDRNPRMLH